MQVKSVKDISYEHFVVVVCKSVCLGVHLA